MTVVFAETYDGPAEHLWPGVIARGAYLGADGGLAVFSAHLLRDEFCPATPEALRRVFFDETPVRGRRARGQRMNSPRGTFAEDGVGAVAHELAHAFGLPHDRRRDDRDLMGNGFRNLRWNVGPAPPGKRVGFSEENARLLMASRYFARDLAAADDRPPKVESARLAREGGAWVLSLSASDDTGLRAVVLVDRGAESVTAGRALEGKARSFRQRLPAAAATGPNARGLKLQIILADDGGNQTRATVDSPGGS